MRTISNEFMHHVRIILSTGIKDAKTMKGVKQGINSYCVHALPAYISAVTAVETFINEILLTEPARFYFKNSQLWVLEKDWYEKLELRNKLILLPYMLFNQSFKRDQQPYQDMRILNDIRNDVIHYKMNRSYPKYLKDLDQRKITLATKQNQWDADFFWPDKLSCTEGVRWANNTACAVVKALFLMMPDDYREFLPNMESNFRIITEQDVIDLYRKENIDPFKDNPS